MSEIFAFTLLDLWRVCSEFAVTARCTSDRNKILAINAIADTDGTI